jgi:aminoglycoside phosphotransferase (APT) family kinase protein
VAHHDKFSVALKPYSHLGIPRITDVFDFLKAGYMLSAGKQCLVQNDFAPKRLFVDGRDNIIGVIDFEDVQSADPVQDFAEWQFWFDKSVPVSWLKTGYERVQPLGDDYSMRLAALRIERALWALNDFAAKVPDDEWGHEAAVYIRDTLHRGHKID